MDPARARVVDAGELLHDGGGEGDLPARERTEPVFLVERLKAILDCVRLVDIARAEILRQAGEPLPRPVLFEETSRRGGGALPVDHRPTPLGFPNDTRTGGRVAPDLTADYDIAVLRDETAPSGLRRRRRIMTIPRPPEIELTRMRPSTITSDPSRAPRFRTGSRFGVSPNRR